MDTPRNLATKILESHLRGGRLLAGEELELSVDQVLIQDATGTMACLEFEALAVDRIRVPLTVIYVDHNVMQLDDRNMNDQRYLQSFAARFGAHYSRPGNGISHYIHLARFSMPGGLLLGADSHTTQCGAAGMVAIGAGGIEVAAAMAGFGYSLRRPRIVGVELVGALPEWVQAKDVILELLRRHGVRGGRDRIFEFTGPGVEALSVSERATICNMIVETGATTAVFPSDARVRAWLASQGRENAFAALGPDPGATYDETETVDLATLEPLIARPHSPDNVVPVREVAGTKTAQVCVGSSVNGSAEDLALVAAVLRGRIVHPDVQVTVTPGSRQILDAISRSGAYGDLVSAGARVLEPICGPCVGVGQAPSAGVPSVRTFNRNFPGRSGTTEDEVFLCSPATAAATALRGAITDPRELGVLPRVRPGEADPTIGDRQILVPPSQAEAAFTELVKGPTIVAPPVNDPLPEGLEGRVAVVVGDDVSTGDMAPDGAVGMSLWSDIPTCATYMFRRLDPSFYERVRSWGGGFVVAGHNYGQGSSREQAALAPVHLGIRAIVAKSFARIHRSNLIAHGVVPLRFADEADHGRLPVGATLRIDGLRRGLSSGATTLHAVAGDGMQVALALEFAPRERDLLIAGGMLRWLR